MTQGLDIEVQAVPQIPTWFGIGGGADRLARPNTVRELQEALQWASEERIGPIRMLGDGANLLVADDGVDGLVLSLDRLSRADWRGSGDDSAPVTLAVEAGANLPKLIVESVRRGLAGIEVLAGIPATIGGAVYMNAGGAFGQICDAVRVVHALTRDGKKVVLDRDEIAFGYRTSGLGDLVIAGAELELQPVRDRAALRERLKSIMAYKKGSQPMADRSAGCAFKNPTLPGGERESAGRLIDRTGLKGLRVGGVRVSDIHANFLVVDQRECRAAHIVELMTMIRDRVREERGVTLQAEVAYWRRGESSQSVWNDAA